MKNRDRRWLALVGLVWLGPLASSVSFAQASDSHAAARLDPTDFRTRLDFRNRYLAPQSGGHRDLLTSRLDYAFSKTLAIRIDLPYVHSDLNNPRTAPDTGVGDLSARVNYRALRTENYALVVGSEFQFDTAASRDRTDRVLIH
jgi:hypothetical protein